MLTAGLTPVYYHLLLVGWVTQLILGVAIWMFPMFSQAHPRGNVKLTWATYFLLNLGLLLRVVGKPLDGMYAGSPGAGCWSPQQCCSGWAAC